MDSSRHPGDGECHPVQLVYEVRWQSGRTRTPETARSQQFAAYVQRLAGVLGHRDRHEPLRAYLTGLCLPGDRKSIEPMATRGTPGVSGRGASRCTTGAQRSHQPVALGRRADEERAVALEAGTVPAVSQFGGTIPARKAVDW